MNSKQIRWLASALRRTTSSCQRRRAPPSLSTNSSSLISNKVTRLALMNSKLTQSLSMHNLAASFHSDTSGSTPRQSPSSSPSNSQLCLDLGSTMDLTSTPSNLSNALSNMSTLDLPSSSDPLAPSSGHNLQRLNSNP